MNISARLEKLEQKTGKSEFRRFQIVMVEPGHSTENAIAEFKRNHDVHPDDKLMIIQFVAPAPYKYKG